VLIAKQPKAPNLRTRLFKAGSWVVGGFVAGQAVRLVGNLMLTRLLFPEAFGLMAVVYVLMIGLALFSDLGINQGVIRNPRGEEADYLNTAWTIQILRGVLISCMMLLIALFLPIVSSKGWVPQDSVYANPLLPWLIAAFSLLSLIQSAESMNTALASRHLQLGTLTKIELVSQCIALAVMLAIAWTYHSIWALVAGGLISGAVKCIAGHIVLPGERSRFRWDIASVREIIHFGKWIFVLSIIGFVSINGDRLILADLVSASTLGIYSIAFLLANMVNMAFSTISSKLIFPALSEVVLLRPDNVSKVYRKLQITSDIFLFGASGFLFATGSYVVALLYDARYHDAGHMLEVLSLGFIGSRYAIVEQYCMAIGAMRFMVLSTICRMLTLFIGLPLGYYFAEMNGALIAIVCSQFAGWPVALYVKIKHGLLNIGHEFIGVPVMVLMAGMGWGSVQLIAWAKNSLWGL
jgi:O-antigen/teichoic acid export membrane protein